MRKRFAHVALAALLFVGAGCAAQQQTSLEVQSPGPDAAMEAKGDGMMKDDAMMEADANVSASASVDASVDAIIADIDAEQKLEAEANADATVNDAAELNAFSEGSYELK